MKKTKTKQKMEAGVPAEKIAAIASLVNTVVFDGALEGEAGGAMLRAPAGPGEYKVVPREKLRADPNQPRKVFDEEKLHELAASIKSQGILSPIVVMAMPAKVKIEEPNLMHDSWQAIDGSGAVVFEGAENLTKMFAGPDAEEFYQIVFGERRWRAAKIAGLKEVPVIVRELTEREVFIHQFIENQARENLTALDEAKAFTEQIAKRKETNPAFNADKLAEELSIARGTVYNRLVLTRLTQPVLEALTAGKIQTTVAGLIAMIPDPKQQEKLLTAITNEDNYGFPYSFRDVEEKIEEEYCKQLKDAPFDLNAELLHNRRIEKNGDMHWTGPCKTCPKRTGNMKEQFPHIKNGNVCTDPSCYQAKVLSHFTAEAAEAERKGQKVLTAKEFKEVKSQYVAGDKHQYANNRSGTFESLMGKHKPEPVLLVTDEGLQKFYPRDEAVAAAKKNGVKFHKSDSESRADQEKREAQRKEAVKLRESRELLVEGLTDQLIKGMNTLKDGPAWDLLNSEVDPKSWMNFKMKLLKGAKGARARVLASSLSDTLRFTTNHDTGKWNQNTLKIWNALGVDLEAEEKKAAPALPLAKGEEKQKELLAVKKRARKGARTKC